MTLNRFSTQEDIEKGLLKHVPIRQQTIWIATIALLSCAALTVFWSAYTLNQLKNELIHEAYSQAESSARDTCDRVEKAMVADDARTIDEILASPELRAELSRISQDGAIVMTTLRSREGNVIYHWACPETFKSCLSKEVLNRILPSENPEPDKSDMEVVKASLPASIVPVAFPLVRDGETIGELSLGLSVEPAMRGIDDIGARISFSLLMMVIVMVSIFILTVVLVYYVFRRQVLLMHQAVDSQHFASLGALAGGLAHEIRNPLHAMNLHLDVAREDLEAGDVDVLETTQSIQKVQNQITHLNQIVTGFLQTTVPEEMNKEPICVKRVVMGAIDLLRPSLDKHEIEVTVDLPPHLRTWGDSASLHQVFLNLIINAREALEESEEKKILIGAEEDEDFCRVFIEDTGQGIKDGDETKVFQAFVSRKDGGTGFGLTIVQRIMRAHGGTVSASSGKHRGARFTLSFPKRESDTSKEWDLGDQPESSCQ